MRSLLVVLLLALPMSAAAHQRLVTDSFEVTIDARCKEGTVGCENVHYTGVHRKTGRSIRLVGRELHGRCADGVTPCRFLGYTFRNGGVTYDVLEDGLLLVRQGEKVLVQERGTWQ